MTKTLIVSALKGGVGNTTVTAGIASALNRKGLKVGALDADYHAPNLPLMLKCVDRPKRGKGDTVVPPVTGGIKVLSWSMIWPDNSAVMVEDSQIGVDDLYLIASMIKAGKEDAALKYINQLIEHPGGAMEHMKMLFQPGVIDWGELDWLVVDTPPESTGVVKVVAEEGADAGVILVSHPSIVSVADARRTVDLFRKMAVPVYGLVVNQITHNGKYMYEYSELWMIDFCKQVGVPYICAIPHSDNGIEDLSYYFDRIVEYISMHSPIMLPMDVVDEDAGKQALKLVGKLVSLMEVFK